MAGNIPLQQRAGSNIGVINAFSPRVEHTHAKFEPVVLGDQIIWDQTDDDICAVGQVTFYNQSAIALDCDLLLVDEVGNEFPVTGVTSPAAPFGPDDTSVLVVQGLISPMPLLRGYKLLLRVTGPGYVGGAFYNADCASLYGVLALQKDLTTSLQDVVEPPPGKGLGNILLTAPFVVVNTDSVTHKVDVYVEKDGVSTLILKGIFCPINTPEQFYLASLGAGDKLKAVLQEPIATPGKVVRFFGVYLKYDSDVDI